MFDRRSKPLFHRPRFSELLVAAAVVSASVACAAEPDASADVEVVGVSGTELHDGRIPNSFPFPNEAGTAATYSTAGFVDSNNPFHEPQGRNGRSCETCHRIHSGWSIHPVEVELTFWLTGGRAPIFNLLDANGPNADVSTVAARYTAYGMLRKGLFRRGGTIPSNAEFEIIAVDDPLQTGASLTRVQAFRRPLATANFHIARNVGWHDQNADGTGDVHAGLVSQAVGNITGAQQGDAPTPELVEEIVAYEEGLRFAQQSVFGVGLLTSCGAQGGPEKLSEQAPVKGRFDLFDAWIDLVPGSCTTLSADEKRAQIARGQELFNATNPGGGSCRGCHDAANNGSNVDGILFDVGASRPEFRKPGMPLYTLRNKATGEIRQTTDPGRAIRTGLWQDVDRFKTPSLRGVVARAPYFHNGIAPTLEAVILHYEEALGFVFTKRERKDLVAFLEAL
nr:MAG: hypothetical protein DIU78_12185 [Pseudomonadota bacterium]